MVMFAWEPSVLPFCICMQQSNKKKVVKNCRKIIVNRLKSIHCFCLTCSNGGLELNLHLHTLLISYEGSYVINATRTECISLQSVSIKWSEHDLFGTKTYFSLKSYVRKVNVLFLINWHVNLKCFKCGVIYELEDGVKVSTIHVIISSSFGCFSNCKCSKLVRRIIEHDHYKLSEISQSR